MLLESLEKAFAIRLGRTAAELRGKTAQRGQEFGDASMVSNMLRTLGVPKKPSGVPTRR